jgi:hypothetical protein
MDIREGSILIDRQQQAPVLSSFSVVGLLPAELRCRLHAHRISLYGLTEEEIRIVEGSGMPKSKINITEDPTEIILAEPKFRESLLETISQIRAGKINGINTMSLYIKNRFLTLLPEA